MERPATAASWMAAAKMNGGISCTPILMMILAADHKNTTNSACNTKLILPLILVILPLYFYPQVPDLMLTHPHIPNPLPSVIRARFEKHSRTNRPIVLLNKLRWPPLRHHG